MTWDPTSLRYGQLNDIRVPAFSPIVDHNRHFWSVLHEIVRAYYHVNTFAGTGPYKGYVLKVLKGPKNPPVLGSRFPIPPPPRAGQILYLNPEESASK